MTSSIWFQQNSKAKFLSVCLTILILLSYVFGVLISQPESSFSMGGMLTKLSGESAYALMSLLGASIMPHNFYLHSSIVQVFSLSLYTCACALFCSCILACNLFFGLMFAALGSTCMLWQCFQLQGSLENYSATMLVHLHNYFFNMGYGSRNMIIVNH